jgi:hypothetical protein
MSQTNEEKALSDHLKEEDRSAIEEFIADMNLDEPVPVEEFRRVVRTLLGARGRFLYFVWKILQEKGLDADGLLKEICFRWGQFGGRKMADVKTPADFLKKISAKAGTLAWEQEYTMLGDLVASKEFNFCPHMAAMEDAGASKEELAKLCKEMLCYGDYGIADPHPVKLEWVGRTLGEGGKNCVMMITPKKQPGRG